MALNHFGYENICFIFFVIFFYSPQKESKAGLEQMKLLFTLLLGAAVQCPNKQFFIARIKELEVATQLAIVDIIKKVTDTQTLVLNTDTLDTERR